MRTTRGGRPNDSRRDVNQGVFFQIPGDVDVLGRVFALWLHMTLRARLGDREGPVTSVPSSDLILSRLYLQIGRNWNYTHLHTRNAADTHAHTARLSSSLTSRTLCPLLVWLFLCLSLSSSDSRSVIHMHAHLSMCARTHTHEPRRWNCCVILPAVPQCLSSYDSSVEIGPTESSVRCYLQVKCAWLSHSAAAMTTLKCFLFLERPQNATALTQLFAASCGPTVSIFDCILLPVWAILPSDAGAVHLLSPPHTLMKCERYLLQVGAQSCLTQMQAHMPQTPTLPHTAKQHSSVFVPYPALFVRVCLTGMRAHHLCWCVSMAWPNTCKCAIHSMCGYWLVMLFWLSHL